MVLNYLAFNDTRLVFQKEVVLEESKVGRDSEVNLIEMDEDSNL
jgi:hypothetical protein